MSEKMAAFLTGVIVGSVGVSAMTDYITTWTSKSWRRRLLLRYEMARLRFLSWLKQGGRGVSRKNYSETHGRLIQPGQIWMCPLGQATDKPWSAPFRVMAVAEGYVLGRLKGATPFVVTVKEMAEWKLAAPAKQEGGECS